ncbi:MAG TPA: fumarylacetoacetate hydrolase family protein [Anaeromyxobacteraceae bacterium]|jgi:fumarylacetoacetate (FAA) hydrolase|nr:fumarylacetoacetate hydrolase family protein [Anaeromyxobacteraceae bacterium]
MRLATLRDGTRDGRLAVVRRDGAALASAAAIAPTLQAALDGWEQRAPLLRALAEDLDRGRVEGEPVVPARLHAPLPRAYEWVDGSAYLNHVRLARRARGAEPPPGLETDPLVYQGGSGVLLGPTDPAPLLDPAFGLDLEGELVAILGDVPQGTRAAEALPLVRLLCLANDLTFRNLVPSELAKGFGFFQSKPATAFAPFAVTPDELGPAWRDGRVHLRLRASLDGALLGDCDAGPEMHFSFADLVQHLARTRAFTAGTLLGSGTVSNADPARGVSCLAERRMREVLEQGAARTPFLARGQRIALEVLDPEGRSLFGRIEQEVV